MKKTISAVFVIMAMLAGSTCPAAETGAGSGMHFTWWKGDNSDTGMQFYIPVHAGASMKDFSFELLGAYIYSEVNPDAGSSCSLSQMSDTKLNLSYSLYGKLPVDILFGLGFNLPTGHTDLTPNENVLVVPPDLFPIHVFGEGFNINPTLSIAREWGKWVAGIGVGYTWRGEYDYSYDIQDYDPGDAITVTGEVRHDFTSSLTGKLFGQYTSYEKDKRDGDDFYREGPVEVLGISMLFNRENWDCSLNLTGIMRGKSKTLDLQRALVSESKNCHGDELNTDLSFRYHLDSSSAIRPGIGYLYIAENDYASTSGFYVGKRQKITLGIAYEKAFARDFDASFGISGFLMDDDQNWYHPDEDVKYKGVSLNAFLNKKF